MQHIIYKYPIPIDSAFTIPLPAGSRILHVDVQFGETPCLWALHPLRKAPSEGITTSTMEPRHFRLLTTGQPVNDSDLGKLKYIGTFMVRSGQFVGHLFEVTSDKEG